MASALPKLDISITDHRWDCRACPYKHQPGAACPRPGQWLAERKPVRHLELVRRG